MAVKYQTGVSTLAQFVSVTLLNLIGIIAASVQGCIKDGSECIGDTALNLLYFLVLSGWFAFIWVLGYAAQDRRSKRMAQVLILAELAVVFATLINIKGHTDLLGLLTSLVDLALAAWTILLAWRLWHAGGGRVTSSRPRRRSSR